jgi:hypothetical protein
MPIASLPGRGVVEVAGDDRVSFLQGLVSNDVAQVAPSRAAWAALLTPQGKWLADFFVLSDGERLLIDCAADQAPMLVGTLSRFRLRAKVALRDASADFTVHAGWGDAVMPDCVGAPDPRLPGAGWRALATASGAADAGEAEYDLHRLSLGLPEPRDMQAGSSVLLEGGFDELNGISWTKGCYMGQELTARTKYRGLLKRRLFPVVVAGDLPAPGTPVLGDGREVGAIRSGRDGIALALLRIEAAEAGGTLTCGAAALRPLIPAWMRLATTA